MKIKKLKKEFMLGETSEKVNEVIDVVNSLPSQPSPKCIDCPCDMDCPKCKGSCEQTEPKCECGSKSISRAGDFYYCNPCGWRTDKCTCEEAKTEWWGNWDNVHSHHKGNVHWIGKKGACPHCDEEDTYELPNGWQIDQFSRTHGYEPKPESWEERLDDLAIAFKYNKGEGLIGIREFVRDLLDRVRSEVVKEALESEKSGEIIASVFAQQSLREELATKIWKLKSDDDVHDMRADRNTILRMVLEIIKKS